MCDSPLLAACRAGDAGVVSSLLAGGSDACESSDCSEKWTPLVLAAGAGSEDCVMLLLSAGAKAQPQGQHKHYPLRAAALRGHLEVAKVLVENGADVNQKSFGARTPLHGATMNNHCAVVRWLAIERGADASIVNDFGETALDIAREKGFTECIQVLSSLPLAQQITSCAADLARKLQKPVTWIAIAGIPGAGKSTIAAMAKEMLEKSHAVHCQVVPMDGYHLPKSVLDKMADPVEAHYRRGAPFTFDASALFHDLQACIKSRDASSFAFPSWDHHIGDPGDRTIVVDPGFHRVVFVEGNYLLLADGAEPWPQFAALFDECWVVDCSLDTAVDRVTHRNALAFGWPLDRTRSRVEAVDRANMLTILQSDPAKRAQRVLRNNSASSG